MAFRRSWSITFPRSEVRPSSPQFSGSSFLFFWVRCLPFYSCHEPPPLTSHLLKIREITPLSGTKIYSDRLWQWKVRSVLLLHGQGRAPIRGLASTWTQLLFISPVLLQQMLTRSVSGTEELPHSTASPAKPTEENHEMMINTQFSLKV